MGNLREIRLKASLSGGAGKPSGRSKAPTGRLAHGRRVAPIARMRRKLDYDPPNWVLTEVKVDAAFVPIA